MTAAGLDARRETTAPLMHNGCSDRVIQLSPLSSYAVFEVVEISYACFIPLHVDSGPQSTHYSETGFKSGKFGSHSRGEMNFGLSLSSGQVFSAVWWQ